MPGFFGSFLAAMPYSIAIFIAGYLAGSIPFGLILTRAAGLGDLRSIGSGNIGATNVLRTGSKKLAAATLLLDAGKGALAVLIVRHLYGLEPAIWAGTGAIIGHMFPVWLRFRGGKGVATGLGILMAIAWKLAPVVFAVWLLMAVLFRYSSLAALVAAAAAPIAAWFIYGSQIAGFALLLAILVWLRHRENIGRLLRGQESKIRLRKSAGNA